MKQFTIGFKKLHIDIDALNSTGYTTCPSCSESRKQSNKNSKVLKVYPKTGYYDCKHCDYKGRVDSDQWIEEKHEHETGLKKVTSYNQLPKQKKQVAMKPFQTGALTTQAVEYLKGRSISKETAVALNVAWNQGALCFNYYKDSEIIGAKYRLINRKFFWQHAGCDKYLYNLHNLREQAEICLVEGEFDVMAIYESGFKQVGSVSQGAPNAGQEVGTKLQCLDNSIDYIKNAKRVIIWTDGDANGCYLQKVLIERFGSNRCATVVVPAELIDKSTKEVCKDANAVLINYGSAKVLELIKNAKDTPIDGVRTVRQVESEMWETYHNGYRKGVPTEIKAFANHFTYYKPWWNLSYGIPNSGKSELELFKMVCMSVHHGWKWACFVPEAYPASDFYNDCIMKLTGRGVDIESDNRLTEEEYQIAIDFINEHFFFIYPQDDKDASGKPMSNNFDNVIDKIKELKLSKGIDGFLIDPINQLSASASFVGTKDEKLEQMYGAIDIVCKTHFLSGNLIAHPRTLYKDKDDPDYRPPTPYEIAGGAMNYNKAYCILCVHRPYNQSNKNNTLVNVDIQKVKKHKVAGKPALVDLNFDRRTGWYYDLDGTCALEHVFNNMCAGLSMGKVHENTFTNKLANVGANGRPLDHEGEEIPF